MSKLFRVATLTLVASLALFIGTNSFAKTLEFSNEETIVLLGDALIEQEQYYGWIEVALTTSMPEKKLHFRNLGWSGDTPAGKSRFGLSLLQAGREPADEGWKQLKGQLELVKPTVLVLGYGMASSLELGVEGVDQFIGEYQQLLTEAKRINPNVRFIFLSPISRSDSDPHAKALSLTPKLFTSWQNKAMRRTWICKRSKRMANSIRIQFT